MRCCCISSKLYITGVIGRAMNATCLYIREAIHQSGSYYTQREREREIRLRAKRKKEKKKKKKKLINNN